MKWLIRIVLVLVVLLVIAAVAGFVMIDSIATAAVSKGAAFATQTDVSCDKVDVKVFGSTAQIDNLDIKNPDGPFRDKFDSFLKLGNGSAQVTAGSVFSDKIVIPKVELSDIEITLVGLDDGNKNYETILKSLKRFEGDQPPPPETKDQKQVVIKELIIRNITVKYDFAKDPALNALPVKGEIKIADKEPMVLTDVGSGGVPMSQVTADIITDILVQVMANLGDDIGNHVLGLTASLADTLSVEDLQDTLNQLGVTDVDLGEQLKELGNLGGELGEKAGEWLKQGGGSINDITGKLLGGDKDKKDDTQKDDEKKDGGNLLDRINPLGGK